MKVDIAIMTIREDEFTAVRRYFKTERQRLSDGRTYLIGEVKTEKRTYTIAIVRCNDQGSGASERLAHYIIQNLNPQLILVVGIASGIPHDEFTLGDVILSTRIVNPNVDGGADYITRGGLSYPAAQDIVSLLPGDPQLKNWAVSIQFERPDLNPEQVSIKGNVKWREQVRESLKWHFGEEKSRGRSPTFTAGLIISSNHLMKDPVRLSAFLKTHRAVLAVEMEVAGVYEAAQGIDRQYPVMAIRGISDIVGLKRDARWTAYACQTAAAFTYALIMADPFDLLLNAASFQKPAVLSEVSTAQLRDSGLPLATQLSGWLQKRRQWTVPFERNLFFTGRKKLLENLYDDLSSHKAVALTQAAISGLGGIGKTQTAMEYAYRYRDAYEQVLWVNSATYDQLISGFTGIAQQLDLPEQTAQNQHIIVEAVKKWLAAKTGWLLVFDNADVPEFLKDFFPSTHEGHILVTTRSQGTAQVAKRVEVGKMDLEESSLLLLRRANLIESDDSLEAALPTTLQQAKVIAQALDGLPLALDQAGAYMAESGVSLNDYLDLYEEQCANLLRYSSDLVSSYPLSVAASFSLSFQKIGQINPAAAELLRLCAFLAPDNIPEEIFAKGILGFGSALQLVASESEMFDSAIKALSKFSLVMRNAETQTFRVHRLVQAVLQDTLDAETQRTWAERAVRAVNSTLPKFANEALPNYELIIFHILASVQQINKWDMAFPEAANLLNQIGSYFEGHSRHIEALQAYQRALSIYEKQPTSAQPSLVFTLKNLATLYEKQGKYIEALPLFQRILMINEETYGLFHSEVAADLDNLAWLYQKQDKYSEALPLYQRALAIYEHTLGPTHPNTALSLNNLAVLYQRQGKYQEALPLYQHALAISEQTVGPSHPFTATNLNNLAWLYQRQGRYTEALPLYQRALAIREQALGPEHPNTAAVLNNLAVLYKEIGEYARSEPLHIRSLSIVEKVFGSDHPDTAGVLSNLAALYSVQGKYQQAIPLFQRALAIMEKALGFDHPGTSTVRENYDYVLQEIRQKDHLLEQVSVPLLPQEQIAGTKQITPPNSHEFQASALIEDEMKAKIDQRLNIDSFADDFLFIDESLPLDDPNSLTPSLDKLNGRTKLSLLALARANLEWDNYAIVNKIYSAEVGISQKSVDGFIADNFQITVQELSEPIPFDIIVHPGEYVQLIGNWHQRLWYDPTNPNPQITDFQFRANKAIKNELFINFYRKRQWLTTIHLEFDVIEQPVHSENVSRG